MPNSYLSIICLASASFYVHVHVCVHASQTVVTLSSFWLLNYCLCPRVKTPKNQGLLRTFVFIQLLPQGMGTLLMAILPVCVLDELFIMIPRQEKKILQRMVFAAISYVTQSLETRLR